MKSIVGYARTSTVEQQAGFDAQLDKLKAEGCTRIFSEQLSSVSAKRVELAAALSFLRDGDVFVVTAASRLARDTRELLNIVDDLNGRSITVRIVDMGIDTSTPTGRLLLTLMGAVAAFEREVMLERQKFGVAKAKAEGKYKGRAPTARSKTAEVNRLLKAGCKPVDIMKLTNISKASFYRIKAEATVEA